MTPCRGHLGCTGQAALISASAAASLPWGERFTGLLWWGSSSVARRVQGLWKASSQTQLSPHQCWVKQSICPHSRNLSFPCPFGHLQCLCFREGYYCEVGFLCPERASQALVQLGAQQKSVSAEKGGISVSIDGSEGSQKSCKNCHRKTRSLNQPLGWSYRLHRKKYMK